MPDKILCSGWACTDCLVLLANGETDPDWTEDETAEFLARFNSRNAPVTVTLGMLSNEHSCHHCAVCSGRLDYWQTTGEYVHADDEPADSHAPDPVMADECECERQSFSWSSCDVCGSNLGGERNAVTFWEAPNAT